MTACPPPLVGSPPHLVLVFDGTCDFCTRAVRLLRRLDRSGRVTPIPFQRTGIADAYGLAIAQCERAAWAITPTGDRYPAAAAINVALSAALGSRLPWLVYRLPGIRQAQDRAYAVIARNRSRLRGDTPYCEQFPDACA